MAVCFTNWLIEDTAGLGYRAGARLTYHARHTLLSPINGFHKGLLLPKLSETFRSPGTFCRLFSYRIILCMTRLPNTALPEPDAEFHVRQFHYSNQRVRFSEMGIPNEIRHFVFRYNRRNFQVPTEIPNTISVPIPNRMDDNAFFGFFEFPAPPC